MIPSHRGDDMFDILLEKQDKIIFRVFQYLQIKNPCPLKEITIHLGLSLKSLKRYIFIWQQNESNVSMGISFYIKGPKITAIYSPEDANLFLSSLLARSFSFQILVKIIENPFCTFKKLEDEFYLSKATMQRRMQKMKPLLSGYDLTVSFTSAPTLKGNELQIRYFSLLVSLLYDPPFTHNKQMLYERYKEVQQYRNSQGFLLSKAVFTPITKYYPIPFQINDTSLLFLWKQFSGIENIWLKPSLTSGLDFALHAHTALNELKLISLSQKLHRLHSLCDLYSGSFLFTYNPFFFVKDAKRLTQSFTKLLPNYQQILTTHPELPYFYEKLLQYESSSKNSSQIIAED